MTREEEITRRFRDPLTDEAVAIGAMDLYKSHKRLAERLARPAFKGSSISRILSGHNRAYKTARTIYEQNLEYAKKHYEENQDQYHKLAKQEAGMAGVQTDFGSDSNVSRLDFGRRSK